MATPQIFDRVMESSVTAGTGPYALLGAVRGFMAFSALGDGGACHYCAQAVDGVGNPSGEWEIGLGTFTASGSTLSRDTIYASTNFNARVNWPAGQKRVFLCQPAATSVETDRANTFSQPQTMTLLDLVEVAPTNPPVNTERLYALDVNGYTQVEMRDSVGRGARFASDNILIAKVAQAGGVTRGQLVYLSGAAGANALVSLAKADAVATMPTMGMVLDTAANNAFTRVLVSGTIQGLDTSAFAEGVLLYVSPVTAGAITNVLPTTPNYAQRIGFVTRSHATQGELLVLTTAMVNDPRLHHATHELGGTDQLQNVVWTVRKTTNQVINAGAGVFADVTGLTFPVVNGQMYAFYFYVVFQAAQTTTGYRCSVNCPAGTLDFHAVNQVVANAAAGVSTWTHRHNTVRDDMTVTTSTITAAVDLVCIVQGRYLCTADGTLAVRFGNELANTDIVVQAGSWGWYF